MVATWWSYNELAGPLGSTTSTHSGTVMRWKGVCQDLTSLRQEKGENWSIGGVTFGWTDQEKRSPFLGRYGCELSYLLFSITRWPSVVGACLVGAGSRPASLLGEPVWSVLAGPEPLSPLPSDSYSSDRWFRFCCRNSSDLARRSALICLFAKMYAPPPAVRSSAWIG